METENKSDAVNNGSEGETRDDRREAADRVVSNLIANDRILLEAIMLPTATDGPLAADKIAEVVDAFRRYLQRHDLSVYSVHKGCGYSPTTLSEWMAGKYNGDVDEVTRRVNLFIERDARQRASRRPTNFITTQAAQKIGAYIKLADQLCKMLAIVADSGAGKSRVLRYWCDQLNGVMVTCVAGMRPRDTYQRIDAELGIHTSGKATRMELLNTINDKLFGSKKIIFLDEAHLLGQHIGCVRPIFDIAKVPIVMAGAGEILSQIDADRNHGIGQMASRTLRCDLTKIAYKDTGRSGRRAPAVLFTMEEIARFFQMKQMRITRDAHEMLYKLANLAHRGRLRLIEDLADTAFNADKNLSALTRRHVIAALEVVAGDMAEALIRDAEDLFEAPASAAVAVARAG